MERDPPHQGLHQGGPLVRDVARKAGHQDRTNSRPIRRRTLQADSGQPGTPPAPMDRAPRPRRLRDCRHRLTRSHPAAMCHRLRGTLLEQAEGASVLKQRQERDDTMSYTKGLAHLTIVVASAVFFLTAACAPSDPSGSDPSPSATRVQTPRVSLPGVPAGASTKDIYDAMLVAA